MISCAARLIFSKEFAETQDVQRAWLPGIHASPRIYIYITIGCPRHRTPCDSNNTKSAYRIANLDPYRCIMWYQGCIVLENIT